jgi:ketosteroid isomerase-like protein
MHGVDSTPVPLLAESKSEACDVLGGKGRYLILILCGRYGVLKRLALPLLLFAGTVAAQTPDASTVQGKILALENAWGQAEKAGDSNALRSLLDDTLVYVRYDGSLWTKSRYLASLSDPTSRVEQAITEDMAAHVFGDASVVTGIYRVKGTEKGKPYARRERFIDTWVHRGDNWVCVATQVTLIAAR